jgi:hypothetical protein
MNDVIQAIATALEPLSSTIPELQVTAGFNTNPSPPSIDIYPAPDTFLERSAYGEGSWEAVFVIRARVNTADTDAGQELLLELMDPRNNPGSVIIALTTAASTAGLLYGSGVEFPTGYGEYADPAGNGTLLGCVWRLRVEL